MFKKYLKLCLFSAILTTIYAGNLLAAATPVLTASATSAPLLGDQVSLQLTLDNSDATDTGYFPIFRFVLPDELDYNSIDNCGGLGSSTVDTDSSNPGTDPWTGEEITLGSGETLVVIRPNIGQVTPDQPVISCTITLDQDSTTAFTTYQITKIRGIFVLGSDPGGSRDDCGGAGDTVCTSEDSEDVTPTLYSLSKTSNQSNPTGTGPTYPITFTISGDLATGETINSVTISDTIPDSIVLTPSDPGDCSTFTISPVPTSCSFTADATSTSGGTISLSYTTLSADTSLQYSGYIRKLDDDSNAIVNATTGVSTTSQNSASANATEFPSAQTADVTINQHAVSTTKSVSNSNDIGGSGNTPGDTLTYTISMAVSDYFQLQNITFDDTLSDGHDYQHNTLNLTVVENGSSESLDETTLIAQGHFSRTYNGATGEFDLSLDLGAAMADPANSAKFPDTILAGDDTHGSGTSTTVTITYDAVILDDYTLDKGSGDLSVDAADSLNNNLNPLEFDIVSGSTNLTRTASASATIAEITSFTKDISHVNGSAPPGGTVHVSAGDTVTYKITTVIPGGDVEDMTIVDYLPRPLFTNAVCPTHDGSSPPASGGWSFGTNESGVASGSVTVTCNATNNTVQFAFPDFDSGGGASATVEIYFTVTAQNEPIADGLLQTNLVQLNYNDSTNAAAATAVGTTVFIGDAPSLSITRTATVTDDAGASISSGNVSDIDGYGLITFQVAIENSGEETAFDVTLEDILPSGFDSPSNPTSCSDVATCGYNVSGETSADCTNSSASTPDADTDTDQTKLKITDLQIASGATCTITYQMRVESDIDFAVDITGTATTTYASELGGTSFSPEDDDSTTTIIEPSVSKATSDSDGEVPDPVTFSITVTLPEGEGANFKVIDVESSTNFFEPTAVAVTGGISGAGPYCTDNEPTICFTNDPTDNSNWNTSNSRNFTVNLGATSNTSTDDTDRTFTLEITGTTRDVSSGTRGNRGRVRWDNPSTQTVTSSSVNYTVLTPDLSIVKCSNSATSSPLSLAGSASYTILVKNSGSNLSGAYDVSELTDNLAKGVSYTASSVSAYYCDSGASAASCADWVSGDCTGTATDVSATVRSGESLEVSPFGGDERQEITFPIVDASGNPDIATNAYMVYVFTTDISCSLASDSSGVDSPKGTHPDDDGFVDGCTDPKLPFSATLDNSASITSYTSKDGTVAGEASYGPETSNTTTLTADHDGDGISNSDEGNVDADGDGVPNYLDTDSDDNGTGDSTEGTGDADGDGTPDYKDTDDDNDSIDDGDEITANGGTLTTDTDGDGTYDYRDPDSDGDGVLDGSEGTPSTDTDGDGNADYLDEDSDNDGIPDLLEFGLATHDTDGNGLISSAEAAAPGFAGIDSNGDGAISSAELGGFPDQDSDATASFRDLDSDNDGQSDTDEAGLTVFDDDSNNRISATEYADVDDGAGDDVSGGANDNNSALNIDEIPDTDSDGVIDIYDIDSDSDGIPDIVENNRYTCDSNGDGEIGYPGEVTGCSGTPDSDADGLIQRDELALLDNDGDTTYNYQDTDSDDDGIHDWIEAYASNIDSSANGSISSSEYSTAVGGGGLGDQDGTLDYSELIDSDSDSTPDIYETDSDNDTILDIHESDDANDDYSAATLVSLWSSLFDTDTDGTPDFRESDSDNDGYNDSVEAGDASTLTAPVDTDGDSTPDFQDLDSDNDDLNDSDETTTSSSRTTADSDGDSCNDGCEVYGNTTGCPYDDAGNAAWYPGVGTPAGPITDPTDADTDDGGTNDCDEAQSGVNTDPQAGQGADDPYHTEDPDNDGLTNDEEAILGTTNTDNDSDDDGCTDGCEVFGNTTGCVYDDTQNSSWYPGVGSVASPITDALVVDTDGDGCNDCFEASTLTTDPRDSDTDDDNINDCQENNIGTDPKSADSDGDGLNDGQEVNTIGSDPLDSDSDDDGCTDYLEVTSYNTDPLTDPDTDGDSLKDCEENATYGTDHTKADTDGGGISDGEEVNILRTDPLDGSDDCPNPQDTDGDGLTDCEELERGLDPLNDDGVVTIQGSGTKSLFGVGCGNVAGKVDFALLLSLLTLIGLTIFRNRKRLAAKKKIMLLGIVIFFVSSSAFALNVQLFRPHPGNDGAITNHTATSSQKNEWNGGLFFNWVKNPIEFGLTTNDQRTDEIVNWFMTTDVMLSYGISNDFTIGLELPINLSNGIEEITAVEDEHDISIGDLQLWGKYQLTRQSDGSIFNFALIPFITATTGKEQDFFSDKGFTYGLRLALDRNFGKRHYLGFNVGLKMREREVIYNLKVDDELTYGASYSYLISKKYPLRFIAEVFGSTTFRKFFVEEVTSPFEALFALRKDLVRDKLFLTFGAGRGLNNGYGSPDMRLFAGLTFSCKKKKKEVKKPLPPVVPPSFLALTITDQQSQPLPANISLIDKDNKKTAWRKKNQLKKKLAAGNYQLAVSAPEHIAKAMTIEIKEGQTLAKEIVLVKQKKKGEKIMLLGKVLFEFNSDKLKEESKPILDKVIATLKEHPEVKKVLVAAHTDSKGADTYNLDLSQRRAKSVKDYLLSKDIAKERLQAIGFGETEPVATNDTAAGRAENRRVEFKILEVAETGS